MLGDWCCTFSHTTDKTNLWSYITLHLHNCQRGLQSRDASWVHLLLKPSVFVHMLNFTGLSRKWCWQSRFEVKRGQGSSTSCWHESTLEHTLLSESVVDPTDHLYLHNLGFIGPKQNPCVNYLWRCNDFRTTADLHLVSKVKLENRLRFRHVTVVLSQR